MSTDEEKINILTKKLDKIQGNLDRMIIRKWKTDISDICYRKLHTVVNDSDPNYRKCLSKLAYLYKCVIEEGVESDPKQGIKIDLKKFDFNTISKNDDDKI